MIYFRNNGNEREKYLITYDDEKLKDLILRVALHCGEQSIKKEEVKHAPRSYTFYNNDDEYHYYGEVHSKLSKNKGVEWDHYEEYEVDLYDCEYIDYLCPPLVSFITDIYCDDKKAMTKLFNRNLKDVCNFPKVKDKIIALQEEITGVTQSYSERRNNKVEELNKSYASLTQNVENIEDQIKQLQAWTSKTKKELLKMDKDYLLKMNELNDRLKYLLSIEKQNENQEDVTSYIEEIYSLVDIRLIDKISLDEINRVRDFQSGRISPEKEMQLLKKI